MHNLQLIHCFLFLQTTSNTIFVCSKWDFCLLKSFFQIVRFRLSEMVHGQLSILTIDCCNIGLHSFYFKDSRQCPIKILTFSMIIKELRTVKQHLNRE